MYIDEMFPDELHKTLSQPDKNGIGRVAVLPIGSVEQHGPHLLLGCDSYISVTLAHMTAKKLDGVLYPMIPFSWIGGLRPYAGTIDMRPFLTAEYLEQVCLGIFRQGFSRLVVINCHGGGRDMVFSVCRRLYKKTGKPVITLYPTYIYDNWPEIENIWHECGIGLDWAAIETSMLAGSLQYLGKEKIADKVLKCTAAAVEEFGEYVHTNDPPGIRSAFKIGEVGHDYNHECMHVQPRKNINPGAGLKAVDFMAEKMAWGAINAE